MSQAFKQIFRRMNLDSDCRALRQGDYRKLTNGTVIQPKSSSTPSQDVISSLFGNATVANADLAGGTNKVIGFLEDRANSRCFFSVYNSTAANNTVYQYKAGVVTRILRSALFAFAATDYVDMDINGEILVLSNNGTEIWKINVTKALASFYPGSLQQEDITLIKRPGTLPLGLSEVAGTGRYSYSGYQFYYRYIYEDGDASVFSATSRIYSTTTPNTTLAVILRITFPVGETVPDTVQQIEYAFRLANSNEFTIYRTERTGSFSANHDFSDELIGETVPDSQSFKWYDVIPTKAKAIKWFRTRLFLGNYPINQDKTTTLSGVAALATADTTIESDSVTGIGDNGNYVFQRNSRYKFGILFTDWAGRHVGVYRDPNLDIDISDYEFISATAGPSLLGYIGKIVSYDLTALGITNIPTWATNYQWVRTKNLKESFFISNVASDAFYYKKDADGVITYAKTNKQNYDGLVIDLSNLTKQNIGYTFSKGDRIRLYAFTAGTPLVWEKLIEEQTGRFIAVKGGNTMALSAGISDNFYFEIFSPYKGPQVETYYEIGEKFPITNAGTGSRAFSQLTGYIRGDCYMIQRKSFNYSGTYSATNPYANGLLSTSVTFYINAMNPSDLFFSEWVNDIGRGTPELPIISLQQRSNYIKFGQAFVQGATIQQFNTFEALDEYALPIQSGPVTKMTDAGGQVLACVHEIETTALYIGAGFVNTSDENNFLAKTDNVIGDDIKYLKSNGSVHPMTVVARDSRVYFLDFLKGVIVRRSQDGLTEISDYGKEGGGISSLVSSLCIAHAALGANSRIIAGWDPQYECYVISFIDTTGPSGYTLYWHEKTGTWSHRSDLRPEFWGILGQYQLSFLAGALWTQTIELNYNKFFGVQYNRRLEFEIAPLPSLSKIWEALEVDIESLYATAGTNEAIVLLYQIEGGTLQNQVNYLDFKFKNSAYRSAFFKNLNDASMVSTAASKYKSSHNTRGQSAFLAITYNGTVKNPMKSITVFFRPNLNSTP